MIALTPKSPLAQPLGAILTRLCALIAHHAARSPITLLLNAAHRRLWKLCERLDSLVLRWQAGTVRPYRPRHSPRPPVTAANNRTETLSPRETGGAGGGPATPTPPTPAPRLALPNRNAWLPHLLQPTAQYRPGIERYLERPELQELARATPQLARILRPLCRALGIPYPAWLTLPPRTSRHRPPRPRISRPRIPRPKPPALHPDDHPIPANILAAARAWKRKFA